MDSKTIKSHLFDDTNDATAKAVVGRTSKAEEIGNSRQAATGEWTTGAGAKNPNKNNLTARK